MTGPAVLVTARSFSSGTLDLVALLEQNQVQVLRGPATHDLGEIAPLLRRSIGWIAGTSPVTAAHLAAAPDLRIIARYGVGVDAVDLGEAARRGIVVTNTPGANSDAVAEHALALLLAALRNVVSGNRGVRAGDWTVRRCRELRNLRVGIAGFGRIGRALADRLLSLGVTVLAHDPMVAPQAMLDAGVTPCALADLPARCDAVSLHAPGEHQLIDAPWLAHARDLVLINTARAGLIDEPAVAAALIAGRLRTYAADEVGAGHGDTTSPLLAAHLVDQVILTPHSAAQTVEAVDNMGSAAVDAVLAVLRGSPPPNAVAPVPR